MSNNIVKHGQLEDIARDLWTKAKARDIESLTYDPTTKTITGTNADNNALSIPVKLTNLVAIDERAKFTKDVSVNDAGAATNINIGTVDSDQSQDRIVGYRGLTSKKFVDGYVEKLVVHTKTDLPDNTDTTWKVWAVKKGADQSGDRILKAYHSTGTITAQSKTLSVNGVDRKCVEIQIGEEFEEEVYFLVKCTSHKMQVVINIKSEFTQDVVNISEEPNTAPNSTIRFDTNSTNNTAIIHLVGRESITSLAEKLRKTQADGIVAKVNNIAPGADGNVTVTAEHIKTAASSTTNVKQELDKKISNITLKTGDNKKLTVTKADGQNSDVDLTEAFKSENISYTGTIGGTAKNNVKEAIDALNEEAKKGVKKINNGTPDDQGNIAVTVNQTGTTGITMSFGANGDAPVIVATYMTQDEVNQIKGLFT